MPVPAHTRTSRPSTGAVEIRLPWWAVALPSVAFAALLLLILSPGQAHAATGASALGQLVEHIFPLLTR
ncbi:hypothetical protein [Streptomyces pratensis]|uniref:hypothetical protein n=1 Tax=Streptomyces pratensis TaxID=1169025 RepID=UPI00301AE2D1